MLALRLPAGFRLVPLILIRPRSLLPFVLAGTRPAYDPPYPMLDLLRTVPTAASILLPAPISQRTDPVSTAPSMYYLMNGLGGSLANRLSNRSSDLCSF